MAKICPYSSSERETYTVWMKSLVFHGNGCTVFDSKGDVVYRVDNYQETRSSEVLLMDSSGKVLFSIKRKKFPLLWCREGFKWNDTDKVVNNGRPWFRVQRNCTILRKHKSCRVVICNESTGNAGYTIVRLKGKSTVEITDLSSGQLLAEAIPKKSPEGVSLGEDVMTLMVEPNGDHSLVMALVTVYGLVNNRL